MKVYDVYTASFEMDKVDNFSSLDEVIGQALDTSNCYGVSDCSLEASEVTEAQFDTLPVTRIDIYGGVVFVKMVNYIVDSEGEFYDDFEPFQMIELCGEKLTRADASVKFQRLISEE